MKPKIEKGVPLPDRYAGLRKSIAHRMEVGDSVLMDSFRDAKSLGECIRRYGWKASWRKTREGFRVWRVA